MWSEGQIEGQKLSENDNPLAIVICMKEYTNLSMSAFNTPFQFLR